MIPYLIVLILTVVIAYAGRHSGNTGVRRFSIGAIVMLLVLFAGLRNRTVGTDTGNYVSMLASITSFADVWRTTEIGFNALMVLCASLSNDYAVLLTVIALIVTSSYVAGIVLTTKRYETALFLFITLGVYTFFFNGARQGIATSLCFLALLWLLDRRPVPYFLLVGLAALFHHTALVAVPLYFLAVPRTGWRQLAAVAFGAVVMVVFLTTFVQVAALLLDDKYAAYAVEGEGGGRVMVAFLVSQGLILFFLKKGVRDPDGHYQRLLNIYLIGLVPAVAATISSVHPSGLLRLATYFSHVAILLWPMVFVGIKNTSRRGLMSLAFLVTTLAFFVLTTSSFSNLLPYKVNPEFSW